MRAKETRGIESVLAVIILISIAIICGVLTFYFVTPFVSKEASSHSRVPPPIMASSSIIYYRPANMYYLVLRIMNPNPEYLRLKNIILESCNGTPIKVLPVPKENVTIVPYGIHTFNSSQIWQEKFKAMIGPLYLIWKVNNYISSYPAFQTLQLEPIVNITINIGDIKLLYPILKVVWNTTNVPIPPGIAILNLEIRYYVKPYLSLSSETSTEIYYLGLSIAFFNNTGLISFDFTPAFPEGAQIYQSTYNQQINLADIHSISIRIIDHYPPLYNGVSNTIYTEVYLYLNGKEVYSNAYNWTYTFSATSYSYEPSLLQFVNISIFLLEFPRVMVFENPYINLGLGILNSTTSTIIGEEQISIRAPSVLALTKNITEYLENTVLSLSEAGSYIANPTSTSPPPQTSVYVPLTSLTLVHPVLKSTLLNIYAAPEVTIEGTLYNFTNIIGPYEFKQIALEFTSNVPIQSNGCYIIMIDTDKGLMMIRNNGFIIVST